MRIRTKNWEVTWHILMVIDVLFLKFIGKELFFGAYDWVIEKKKK